MWAVVHCLLLYRCCAGFEFRVVFWKYFVLRFVASLLLLCFGWHKHCSKLQDVEAEHKQIESATAVMFEKLSAYINAELASSYLPYAASPCCNSSSSTPWAQCLFRRHLSVCCCDEGSCTDYELLEKLNLAAAAKVCFLARQSCTHALMQCIHERAWSAVASYDTFLSVAHISCFCSMNKALMKLQG